MAYSLHHTANQPFSLRFCWDGSKEGISDLFLQFLLSHHPRELIDREDCWVCGRRWPAEVSSTKFMELYRRRGSRDLYGVEVRDHSGLTGSEFRSCVYWTREVCYVAMFGPEALWGGCSIEGFVRSLLQCATVYYGVYTAIPFGGYRAVGNNLSEFPVLKHDQELWYMLNCYQEAGRRWEIRKSVASNTHERNKRLRLVYTFNMLTGVHVSAEVSSAGCTLLEWIERSPNRGTCEQITSENWLWHVLPGARENVVRELWSTGLFPASEHFEVVAWDTEANLPCLAAKPSAMEFLVQPDKDRLIFVK